MKRLLGALVGVVLALSSASAELKITKHARTRMTERGVTEAQVREIVATVAPFSYSHEGRAKTGYYDEKSRVFIATADEAVITVIANATPRYVANLKRKSRQRIP